MNELKKSFDNVANEYDRYRTGYDPYLIADIKRIASLGKGSAVCEIGAGTGQASVDFAPDVSTLVCVEPGRNLSDKLRRNLSTHENVEFVTAPFEDAELETTRFQLVFAAQSFHWVDSAVRYRKVFEILHPGGWFAAFGKRWIPSGKEALFPDTKLFQEYLPDYVPFSPQQAELDALADLSEMVNTKLFSRCQLRRYPTTGVSEVRPPEDRAESFRTWSMVAALEKTKQDELISRLTEVYRNSPLEPVNNETTLVIGQKRG